MFRPLVDVRARIYDMQHDPRFADALSYRGDANEVCAVSLKLPREAVRQVNPRIVYGSISGFGQDGPYAGRAGVDQIAQGMGA